ncbi:uncharacterized protein LOC143841715 isoform X2 [Paroedura picta]|uniref:uncharacterized protein LOC143841715 isoform X2 n=1 Tax=Paroedura picta TaxID=143630 RepID=UPI004057A0D9
MEQRGPMSPSLPAASPCPVSENPTCGEEELDEETMNFISALYTALGPLLPEVAKLQGHQDPPAHLMVDVKAKLRELGSSVSDARKRLLQYNVYLKKRLAKAAQEKKALKEQQGEDTSEQGSSPGLTCQTGQQPAGGTEAVARRQPEGSLQGGAHGGRRGEAAELCPRETSGAGTYSLGAPLAGIPEAQAPRESPPEEREDPRGPAAFAGGGRLTAPAASCTSSE